MIRSHRIVRSCRTVGEEGRNASGAAQVALVAALVGCCLLLPIAGGCASGPSYEEQYYILEAARPGEPAPSPLDGTLAVHRFTVDGAFASRNLVYRLKEFQYETDAYRQFLISPGVMITERTRDWLADAGLFRRVLPMSSRIVAAYTLEANVIALYGDFTNESAPAAVMEIRFFLVQNADEETVAFAETYRAATPLRDRTTEVFIAALNKSLADILTRFEADLHKTFAGKPDAAGAAGNP